MTTSPLESLGVTTPVLAAPEIARELSVSPNTVKTHMVLTPLV